MKKTKKPSEKLTTKEKGLIVGLCVVCFGAGVSVPLLMEKAQRKDTGQFEKLETIYDLMTNKWYYANEIDDVQDTLVEQAIDGMTTNEIDPHTTYMGLDQIGRASCRERV